MNAAVFHAVLRHSLRVAFRLGAVALLAGLAWLEAVVRREGSPAARAAWTSRWLKRCLRVCGIRLTSIGPVPGRGLLVANHRSYLDIAVLAAVQPTVFVARHDLQTIPIVGRLISQAGTIYLNRERKRDLLDVIAALPGVVDAGALPTFFPEGYTNRNRTLLPFRSSLFAPAVRHAWPVFPVHIGYSIEPTAGSVAREICWWGSMPFLPHLLNLLAKHHVDVCLTFGRAESPGTDRKALARTLRSRIAMLGAEADAQLEPMSEPGRVVDRPASGKTLVAVGLEA